MRILMIGGTRFIGAHAAQRFHAQGHDVTVLHRGRASNPVLPEEVRHILDPAAEYPIKTFPSTVLETPWDVVVHMVAMGEADAHVAMETFQDRCGRMVLISSGDVYRAYGRLTRHEPGLPDPVPLCEDAPLRERFYPYRGQEASLGAYARDYEKILAERVVSESGMDWTILRLPKVYGPEDNANLATIYAFAGVPAWCWTHGHVDNVAAAIALASLHPDAGRKIYNVGEETTPTMGERLKRLPPGSPAAPPPFDYRQSIIYDTSRIRDELGYCELIDEMEAMAALAENR